jgi:tetratricopeptide (TPR) repeat protein
MIAMAQGEFDEQLACAQRAEAICRANGDAVRLATALGVEGFARLNLGDGAGAVAALEEALELVRRVGEPASTAFVLPAAAFVLADTQPHRARVLAEEAVALAERLGAGWDQQVWNLVGNVATRIGDRREALNYYERGIDGWHWLGWRPFLGLTLTCMGDLLAPDDARSAAVLHGAGEVLAGDTAVPPESAERHVRALAVLDDALTKDEQEELNGEGARLSEEEMLAFTHDVVRRYLGTDGSALNRSSTPGSD